MWSVCRQSQQRRRNDISALRAGDGGLEGPREVGLLDPAAAVLAAELGRDGADQGPPAEGDVSYTVVALAGAETLGALGPEHDVVAVADGGAVGLDRHQPGAVLQVLDA